MRDEFVAARIYGNILLENSFDTPKGKYKIVIRKYLGDIYFFKYRNGELLECRNLSKIEVKGEKSNG